MTNSQPPALATWLMSTLLFGNTAESLIGDLIEQHRRGRSSAWYWRQAARAIVATFAAEMWRHKLVAMWVLALGTYLPQIYMAVVRPRWMARLESWYPRLINWLLENDLDTLRTVAYRLQLQALTTRIVWCVLLATLAWLMSRWHPRQRGLVVTLFTATQIAGCLPYWRSALVDWLRAPDNPIWFFNLLWFSLVTFVAIPFSVLAGSRARETV